MKNILIYFILVVGVFGGCRKSDNPRIPELTEVPLPLFTKDPATSLTISAQDPTTFNATFSVDNFFEDGELPKEMDIVMIKNNNKTFIHTLQENVTSFPSTFSITGQQLIDWFGEPIELGDKFDIGANITTQKGETFLAFPSVGNPYAAGIAAIPGAAPTVRYEAVCQFVSEEYQGLFEVVTDEWADYSEGAELTLTRIDDTHVSFEYLANNSVPIVVEIDPATNSTKVAKQVYGDYGPGYPGMNVQSSAPASDNYVAPCDGILSVRLAHFDGNGGFYGNNLFVIKKVQ